MATKKMSLKEQAEEILRMAEESGVQSNFLFLTVFKRYQVQLQILNDLEEAIKKDGKGEVIHDVTRIKNITEDISSSIGTNPNATFLRDASMLTQVTENSKENISTPETIERMDISLDPETDSVFPADGTRLSRKSVEEVTVPAPWSPGERKGLYISAE